MRIVVYFCLWFVCSVVSAFAQKGVLLHKDAPWDADQFVQATPYKELEKFATVHNVTPMSGNKLRVNSALVVKDIPFPSAASLKTITEAAHVAPLEAAIEDWTATIKRYPTSAKHLKPRIQQLQAEIAQFHAGKVKIEGSWTTKEAHLAKMKKAEEERQKLAAKLKKEAEQLGALASEWEGLDEAGRQRAREAKLRSEDAQMRADEQRRLQEEIERLKKREEERAKMKPVERIATDTWITPPGLNEQQRSDYTETLKVVKEQLSKAKQDLGFGKELQRMVLQTPERVYTFNPAELSPEVQIVRPEDTEKSPAIVLESIDRKEVIVAYPVDGNQPAIITTITLPTVAANNAEEISKGISKIIALFGKKQEPPKEEQK